ncbi:267_t:CDS:2, partial [Acaulospora morrowiae]
MEFGIRLIKENVTTIIPAKIGTWRIWHSLRIVITTITITVYP